MHINWSMISAFLLACILFYFLWTPIVQLYALGTQAGQYNGVLMNYDQRIQKLERWVIEQQKPAAATKDKK